MAIGAGTVVGDIVTDGAVGVLSQGDIIDWSLIANGGSDPPFDLNGTNSGTALGGGTPLSATPTQLSFDFSAPSGHLFFEQFTLGKYVCFEADPGHCDPTENGSQEEGHRRRRLQPA